MTLKTLISVGRDRNGGVFNPFLSLQREVVDVFDNFTRGWPTVSGMGPGVMGLGTDLVPMTDVTETEKEITITAELPGLEEQDVQINLADNVLTIKGEKKAEKEQKDKNYRLIERSYGSFSRSIELPEGVDANAVKASIAKGVLTVVVAKPAPAQVKKIEVKSAA